MVTDRMGKRDSVDAAHHQRRSGSRSVVDVALGGMTAFAFAYLYLPILVIILLSFNDSNLAVLPLRGLTVRWFHQLLHDAQVLEGLRNSVLVGIGAIAVSLPLGVMLAYVLVRAGGRGRGLLTAAVILPLQAPRIILGVLLLILFSFLGIRLSLGTVLLGHVVLTLPFTTLIVAARLRSLDRALEEAAFDLGASRFQTWTHVLFPLLWPAVLSAALIAFTISFDEMVVTYFTIGTESTLPVVIWSMVRYGYSQEINAIGALIMMSTFTLLMVGQWIRESRRPGADLQV